ncbi:MAG: hypothetical protein ABEJ85_04895 [Haloarculaceae archaeon]
MSEGWGRRDVLRRSALAASAGLAGCLTSAGGGSNAAKRLRKHRESLSRFRDVTTAIDEGYRTAAQYVRTDDGVLGIPLVKPSIGKLDPERPQIVLYGLTDDNQYELFGLKWYVPAEKRDGPPSLFGQSFDGPLSGKIWLVPEHYALHAWLFRDNPDGMFALYNPAIDPPPVVSQIDPVRERLRDYYLGSAATKNGYRNTETCIRTPDGGYGVPFVKNGTSGTGGTDPRQPPILLYRLTSQWSYKLLGAEWYVPASETDRPPTLFGQPFHEPMPGHSQKTEQPEHYGLHAWFFRPNPRGMFEPFNPTVQC